MEKQMEKKNFTLDEEMPEEDMLLTILNFVVAGKTEISNVENSKLIEPCENIADELKISSDIHYKNMRDLKRRNNFYGKFPSLFNDNGVRKELDEVLNKVIDNTKFEKYEVKDIIKYLKAIKKAKYYDDMPLLYVTLIGLTKFHNDTSRYYQTQSDILLNELNHIGYIPAKKYDLPSEEYKDIIDIAINRLYGMPLSLFTNEEGKIKTNTNE